MKLWKGKYGTENTKHKKKRSKNLIWKKRVDQDCKNEEVKSKVEDAFKKENVISKVIGANDNKESHKKITQKQSRAINLCTVTNTDKHVTMGAKNIVSCIKMSTSLTEKKNSDNENKVQQLYEATKTPSTTGNINIECSSYIPETCGTKISIGDDVGEDPKSIKDFTRRVNNNVYKDDDQMLPTGSCTINTSSNSNAKISCFDEELNKGREGDNESKVPELQKFKVKKNYEEIEIKNPIGQDGNSSISKHAAIKVHLSGSEGRPTVSGKKVCKYK